MRQVTLGHVLGAVLAALALALGAIATVAIVRTNDHRRDYEDEVARAYRVEAAGWRLTAAEGAALEAEATALARLARDDERSSRLAARLRRAAASGSRDATVAAAGALAGRQGERRADAREELDDRDAATLLAAGAAGGVAVLVAIAAVALIAARMRAPVEELAGAARSLLGERPSGRGGPAELRALAAALAAFDASGGRPPPQLPRPGDGEVVRALEAFGQPLVLCDADGRITHLNAQAQQLLPGARVGAAIEEPDEDEAGAPLAGRTELTLAGRTLGLSVAHAGGAPQALWVVRDLGPAPS